MVVRAVRQDVHRVAESHANSLLDATLCISRVKTASERIHVLDQNGLVAQLEL